MNFYQTPPVLKNPFSNDRLLQETVDRFFPSSMKDEIKRDLERLAERVVSELEPLALEAELNQPVHVPYDPWGNRVDEIRTARAWQRLHEIAAEEGIVASGYERKYGEYSRLYQFAKLYLYHPSSAIYSCPLAMTDGAARVIELHGTSDMKARAYKFLTSRDPQVFWTSGQWMTERTGGSDVSGTETVAKKNGDQYQLYGVKWFTSATTSQMAMTLAKVEGDDKLSMFYVELRDSKGKLQNIQINRLKDKLGTKALPTAELTLNGVPAVLVGEQGKGVKTIATLFNITRLYNACCAVGYMKRGLSLAVDYSGKRIAFGKTLLQHGLHSATLADLQVRFEASFLMSFTAALYLGKEETGMATETESGTLRLLIPLVKLFTAKEGVSISSEVIESFGGAGYVEDTNIPVLLRNAQVLSIWEGTTNVLSLDALRAIKKENAGVHFLQDVSDRLGRCHKHPDLVSEIEKNLLLVKKDFSSLTDENLMALNARTLAMNLSRVYAASLLLEHAVWSGKSRSVVIIRRFMKHGLYVSPVTNPATEKENLDILL